RCFQDGLEPFSAFAQGHLAEIIAIVKRQVEKVIDDAPGVGAVKCILQSLKVGNAFFVQYRDLAIEPARLEFYPANGLDQFGQLVRPVKAASREELDLVTLYAGQNPVAI